MERNRKPLLLGAGALLLVGGGVQLLNLSQLNKELQIEQSAQLYKVRLTGLTVRIDILLKNPTPGQISVLTPNITLSYNGELLASSDNISGTAHVLRAYDTVALDPIFVTLDFLGLAFRAKSFWEQYQATGVATITVRALTRINGIIPVDKVTTFDLGKTPPPTTKPTALSGLAGFEQAEAYSPQRRRVRRLSS